MGPPQVAGPEHAISLEVRDIPLGACWVHGPAPADCAGRSTLGVATLPQAAGGRTHAHARARERVRAASQPATVPPRRSNDAALRQASRNAAATAASAAPASSTRPYAIAYSVLPCRASSSARAVLSLRAAIRSMSSASGEREWGAGFMGSGHGVSPKDAP